MAKANIKADFKSDIKKVWDIVTDLENYGWSREENSWNIQKAVILRHLPSPNSNP
jgi:hypothetical protein